nr:hypothetical protein HUO10_000104 [Paraburkholderia busanensis]
MTDPLLDDAGRAELLTYLVVVQLIAHARTGEWLRTDHLVESTRIWLADRKPDNGWAERINLARISGDVAKAMVRVPGLQSDRRLAKLFRDGWRLDYQSPIVQGMLDVCSAHLLEIQVRENFADSEDRDSYRGYPPSRPIYSIAAALEMAVRATRRAQGKKNPEDLPPRSPEWTAVTDDFLLDLHRAREGEPR